MIKYFLLCFFFVSSVFAGTCTTTSRTNYTTGQVLTSTSLNADLNQLVTKVNSLDGGCITDSSVESTAFDSSLDALKNGIHQGCSLSYVNTNTVSVGKCILSINGNFVKTTVSNNVTWLCSGCSSESVSTQYYVYAKPTSTGTTLNLLISSTSPGSDGFDVSGNKVLGKFWNNYSGEIEEKEVLSWSNNFYAPSDKVLTLPRASQGVDFFSFLVSGGGANGECNSATCTVGVLLSSGNITSVTRSGTGTYSATLADSYDLLRCLFTADASGNPLPSGTASNTTPTNVAFFTFTSAGVATDSSFTAFCFGRRKD